MQDQEITKILQENKRIAVVGLSADPARASHGVTKYLMKHGYEVVGVHPDAQSTLGRPVYASLADVPGPIEIIDVFRKPDAIPGIVDEIEKLMKTRPPQERPKVLWLQEGITHPEAEKRARELGLKVVSDHCILKEHHRLV